MSKTELTLKDLYEIIQKSKNYEEIKENYEKKNNKIISPNETFGNLYEKTWIIMISCGFCNLFPNTKFNHLIGNLDKNMLTSFEENKEVKNLHQYFELLKIESKGNDNIGGGSSDISLQNKKTKEFIFISSKVFRNIKNKTAEEFDPVKIDSFAKFHNIKNYKIYLTIDKNRDDTWKKITRTQNQIIQNMIKNKIFNENHILNSDDLDNCIEKFNKKNIQYDKLKEIILFNKDFLEMRFHQNLFIYKTLNLINNGETEILWGMKPRTGKTYMSGGIVKEFSKNKNKFNSLIITPAPSETLTQFSNELFNKFNDFNEFQTNEIKSGKSFDKIKKGDKNIFIISKQLLEKHLDNEILKSFNFDLIIYDETHFGGTTDISKNILKTFSNKKTIKIFLTATFNKVIQHFGIKEKNTLLWDIEDEQNCKNLNLKELEKKFGKDIYEFVNEENKEKILKIYKTFPDLQIICNLFDDKFYSSIKEEIKDTKYGYSNTALFSLTENKDIFNFEKQVDEILEYISGFKDKYQSIQNENSIYSKINKFRNKKNSREITTQLWFLHYGSGMPIDIISNKLKERMEKNYFFNKYYSILIVNSKSKNSKDIKKLIEEEEIKAKGQKKNLIILAGNKLTLGITLKNVDLVLLLNDFHSFDRITQMMYRCMTEGQNKKYGFVVDFNIGRMLNTCLEYNIYNKKLNTSEKINYLIENNIINLDVEIFKSNETKTDIIKKLVNIWKEQPKNEITRLLNKIQNEVINLDTIDQKELNKYFLKSLDKTKNIKIKFNDETEQEIESGVSIQQERNIREKIDELEQEISLEKDVLPFVIPLFCILTLNNQENDLLKIIEIIRKDKSLLNIFDDQSCIWWKKNKLLPLVEYIIKKYIKKNGNIFDTTIQLKITLRSLIDNKKELLEFIESCLKPKEIERKNFAEVFTPLKLCFEMIDKLDEEYKKQYGKSIFSNKNLKWFDPAVGMGNYMICIYLRLMDGLKDVIKNENERKKWILEEMLYMSELNTKNVFILKQIFNINGKYKMNINVGDTLKLNLKKFKWGNGEIIEKFDVIVGNPPYQKFQKNDGNKRGGGDPLWDKFVRLMIKILNTNGFLLFVHPCGWRKPPSDKSKFKDLFSLMTKENQMIYLEIHNTKDGLKTFNSGTRYDFYIIKKTNEKIKTLIKDENGSLIYLNLNKLDWLPNYDYKLFLKIVDNYKENRTISNSNYETRKKYVNEKKSNEFIFPLIHSTLINKTRYFYSSRNDKGHFGIPKIIFGDSGISNVILDLNGKFGMTQHGIALPIDNEKNGLLLKKILESDKFKQFLNACLWSNFMIDWRMFNYFKNDWYLEFI